jgi:hypothetical protein
VARVKYDSKTIEYMEIDDKSDSSSKEDAKSSDNANLGNEEPPPHLDDEDSEDGDSVLNCMNKIVVNKINFRV